MSGTNTKAYLALIFICVVWGTTYLALCVGVEGYPPFLFSGIRHTIGGSLLLLILFLSRKKLNWNFKSIHKQIVPGILMMGLGNGLVGWAEMYIPSGLAALLCSMMPLYVVLINLSAGGQKINLQIFSGIMLGILGMMVVFNENLADLANQKYLLGIILTFTAAFCWALGSVFTQRKSAGPDPFFNAALQLIFGGLFLLLLSSVFDDWSNATSISMESFWALVYLIIFGSIGAYIAYLYVLTKLPVGLVSIYAYVNPLVAIILGYAILHEKLSWYTILAFIITVLGVYLVKAGYKLQKVTSNEIKYS